MHVRVCVYVAAFARVHIRQCLVAYPMPMYISKHSCLYVPVCTFAGAYYLWYYLYITHEMYTEKITQVILSSFTDTSKLFIHSVYFLTSVTN